MRRAIISGCTVLILCGFTSAGAGDGAGSATTASVAGSHRHQLVPAYFYPSGTNASNPWHIMCRTMNSAGGGSIAILNPASGPGEYRNPPYVEALTYCHREQQKVIGYVSTDYGTRPLSAALRDIDRYYRWYRVDGIFLDEMSNFPSRGAADGLTVGSYYRRIYARVKHETGRGNYVVGNPGAPAATPWQLTRPVADNVVVFEDTAWVYLHRTPPAWVRQRPAREISALVKRTSTADRHRICTVSQARNAGWIDITNDGPPNTWDTLPPYWSLVAPRCR